MIRIVLAVALTGLRLSAAQAAECADGARTQADMTACAERAHRASDGELNALYQQIERRLSDDADTRRRLVAAQRAWVAFRDSECQFMASPAQGGTAYPMVYSGCLADLTQKRVGDLRRLLQCPEGDLACPVPRGG
ncbi:lysozyme inhibitor LprI family protein [Siccirubricoccus phaeus]|uniref:lysozyme inhibitor LprI family protein n=1 Tax=Siccirubricoccus phaeus TaxID=2595053 RepID=UPI0011F35E02|nr:lysozyme inhibitor LprI family protein [Siccirubricoccus phaeus]